MVKNLVLLLVCFTSVSWGAKPPLYIQLPSGQHQLLLDDYLVGALYRVERRINQPVKFEGNPILSADKPWEKGPGPWWNSGTQKVIQIRSAPCWDFEEEVWKLWYIAEDKTGHKTAYARSQDGLHWEKPILGKREYEGSRENNLVVVDGDSDAFIQHVLLDPDAPPERRYKGFIGARNRRPVISADGYVFTKLDVSPIPSQDESHLTYDEVRKQFIATVKHRGPFGRSVFLSLSKDFEKWTDPELIYHADALDQLLGEQRIREHMVNPRLRTMTINQPEHYNTEIYNMPVFPYEGIYIGLPNHFEASGLSPNRNQDGVNSVRLATSRDLRRWVKVGNREAFLPVSEIGSDNIDTGQIWAGSRPQVHGDELWFYYTGYNHRYETQAPYRSGIHLAKLKRDRFASFDSDAEGGFVETRAIRFEGSRLFLNADAGQGEVRVELIDERGRKVLLGWSREEVVPVRGDQLRAEVSWKRQQDLGSFKGKSIRFRFHLYNARLFSFWVE